MLNSFIKGAFSAIFPVFAVACASSSPDIKSLEETGGVGPHIQQLAKGAFSSENLPDLTFIENIDGAPGVYTLDGKQISSMPHTTSPFLVSVKGGDERYEIVTDGFVRYTKNGRMAKLNLEDGYRLGFTPTNPVNEVVREGLERITTKRFVSPPPIFRIDLDDPIAIAVDERDNFLAGAWSTPLSSLKVLLYDIATTAIDVVLLDDQRVAHSLYYNEANSAFILLNSVIPTEVLTAIAGANVSGPNPERFYNAIHTDLRLTVFGVDGELQKEYTLDADNIEIFQHHHGLLSGGAQIFIAGGNADGIAISSYGYEFAASRYDPRIPRRIYYYDFETEELRLTYRRDSDAE